MSQPTSEIKVCENAGALSRKAAEILVGLIAESLLTKDFFSLVLSGGSTPRGLYSLLAEEESFHGSIDWDKIHFFWGDERHVPPDHPDSNYRMARETMLSKVPIPAENIHRFKAELPDAQEAAEEYEKELRSFFQMKPGELPRFDCVLLGMGEDGHTASLFPGTAALEERDRLAVANLVRKKNTQRLTLTAPVLNNSDLVMFLVSGSGKAEALRQVLEGERAPERLPAQLIKPVNGRLMWLTDQAAAAKLSLTRKSC